MSQTVAIELKLPSDLARFQLPAGVQKRLTDLLDRQDQGVKLTVAERREAEGLVEMSEMLSLLKLRSTRPAKS